MGRAKGNIITEIRKELEELDLDDEGVNGIQERRIRMEGNMKGANSI